MELVVDANILFAALIRNNITSKLIVDNRLILYSLDYLFEEFKKYEQLIKNKTERTDKEFERFFNILQKKIKLIPSEEINEFRNKAKEISPDEKDIPYLALALRMNIPIWSNDKRLKKQEEIKIYSTEEIIKSI